MKQNMKIILIHSTLVFGVLINCASVIKAYAEPTYENLSQRQLCKSLIRGELFARTELFFGLSRPNGLVVTEEEFHSFVDREITPRFPEGLTLLTGYGQFMDKKGSLVKESAKLLILLYPLSRDRNQAIEQIRQAYLKQFKQEAVLRIDHQSCVSF